MRYLEHMSDALTAQDVWPLVEKLSHDELVRLAKLALSAAARVREPGAAYTAQPPRSDEFASEDDPLSWEGEGWEQLGASG